MTTLIAGGGLAGAAAACILGSEAILIERETHSHPKVCGEFLSWDTQAYLRHLGLEPATLGAAPIHTVRLVHGRRCIRTKLPGPGLGLSRQVLDEALLKQAARNGAQIIRGRTVRRLLPAGLDIQELGPLSADRVLLATGKHNLRGAKREDRGNTLIGLKMLYRLEAKQAAELAGHVEIVLFPGGYAGLQTIEHGIVNLCLLVTQSQFKAVGTTWSGLADHLAQTSPHLVRRLQDAIQQWNHPLAVARLPYGFVHQHRSGDPSHLFRLGDQMAVIPSFSGDGMAIALHTALAATGSENAETYHRQMRQDLRGQIGRAMFLHDWGRSQPRLLTLAARVWPGAMAWVARLTRVRPSLAA